ncbi:alanine racemase [Leuconostoc citreum]|uniref:alanine racemase n=1 Tax=Leuconostoc citreum TaxID=33964 RepID=UPI001C1F6839|nr:alanine racemase [Leuconostoc citreum]MBU7451223.1 alanine racemase [Leuconostoc citreum]
MTEQKDTLLTRPSWIEIDLGAIQENAQSIMAHAGAKRLIAVVKADGYGHGATPVANALYEIGVRDFAVATIAEGIKLRQELAYQDYRIVLLGVQDIAHVDVMVKYRLSPAIESIDWLSVALQAITEGATLDVELAVDTGMGRMGAHSKEAVDSVYRYIKNNDKLELGGVFTHFATADDSNIGYYKQQAQRFNDWVTAAGIPRQYWHLANSGSALWHTQEIDTRTIRVGSVLYGYNPGAPLLTLPIPLKHVFALKSRIGAVHQLITGESVSYGATYTAQKPQWVATLPIGYADGYLRRMAGMRVLINGKVTYVIGRITMDQIVIALDQAYPIGTEVTLIGRDGDNEITVEEFADYANTIPHEILTSFGPRLPRIYKK